MKNHLLCLVSLAVLAIFATPLMAANITFPQCPAVGADTSGCEFLITVTAVSAGGAATAFTVSTSSPDLGPFDGADDTLVGVLNNSGATLNSIALSSKAAIFGFDGDGACSGAYGPIPGCAGSTDPNGYAPLGVLFSAINAAGTSGVVNFTTGLGPGGSNWFSLEGALTASLIGPATPEPASTLLLGIGLVGVGLTVARRRRITV